MKIIFLSNLDPFNNNVWSGTLKNIQQKLSESNELIWVGGRILEQAKAFSIYNRLKNKNLEFYAKIYAKILTERIERIDADLIFFGDINFTPYLHTLKPIIHLSDTTYHLQSKFIKENNFQRNQTAEYLEQKALNLYDNLIFSSNWAAQDVINYYAISHSKIHVIEFGANIPNPTKYQIEIDTNVCNLVFIGRNWTKKGGTKTLEAYKKLKNENFLCTLTIIGSTPPEMQEKDNDLTIIPFLDKAKPEDLERLCKILYHSHFLILPTEFDAFGIVFCEASAYGVPSIASDVGGVSQPIREGKNGFLLSSESTAEDYAEKIKSVFNDKESYIKLRASSRHEYETRLNWDVWGEKVNKILEETVENYKKKEKDNSEEENDVFYLPVYVINLKDRMERRKHIEEQFYGKSEFELTWVDAVEHPIGAVGLWKSIVKAVQIAEANEDDIMIICEDDHTFTHAYTKEYFLVNIIQAHEQGSELLSGGIGGFGAAVPTAANRYWVDWFWCTQFIVIFKPLFQKILDYDFKDTDTADGVLSVIAKDKMTMYPFISIQKDFGYSDVTRANNEISGMITNHFRQTDYRLSIVHNVAHKFSKDVNK
ncbi:MAG: glycosyltransferase [Fermentimonas sp.]|nr:glycosyltransferase [Fermentimonas sp.]